MNVDFDAISSPETQPKLKPQPQLPPTVRRVHDQRSNTDIYIIGCVHGSQLSASDVNIVIEQHCGDDLKYVVLELDEKRYQALVHDDHTQHAQDPTALKQQPKPKDLIHLFSQKFGGLGPGLLALSLSSFYTVMVKMGLQPGCEFMAGARMADKYKAGIVYGDQSAQDTIKGLYEAMRVKNVMANIAEDTWSVFKSLMPVPISELMRMSVPGIPGEDNPINARKDKLSMLKIFVNDGERMKELFYIMMPAFVLNAVLVGTSSLLSWVFHNPAAWAFGNTFTYTSFADPSTAASVAEGSSLQDSWSVMDYLALVPLEDVVSFLGMLVLGVWTVRFFQQVVFKRDIVLYQSIRDTCDGTIDRKYVAYKSKLRPAPVVSCNSNGLFNIASVYSNSQEPDAKNTSRTRTNKSIVVIVGLLHVNGIAELLERDNANHLAVNTSTNAE